MDSVIRGAVIYLFLLMVFRLYGRRTIGQITTFDFVLLLIVAEAVQNAIIQTDYSVTNAMLVILTLFGLDGVLSWWKHRSPAATALFEGVPLVLIDEGRIVQRTLDRVGLDEADILSAARHRPHDVEELQAHSGKPRRDRCRSISSGAPTPIPSGAQPHASCHACRRRARGWGGAGSTAIAGLPPRVDPRARQPFSPGPSRSLAQHRP